VLREISPRGRRSERKRFSLRSEWRARENAEGFMAKAAPATVKKEIEELREKLRYHEYRYYVLDEIRKFRTPRMTG